MIIAQLLNTCVEFSQAYRECCAAQVCVSYIDESQGYSARQAALRDYGFACTCERCAADSAAAGKGKALA